MAVEVRIPSLGESVSQGVISKWLKKDGESVAADEVLFELETDKAAMEIPAEASGVLEIVAQEGAEVSVGTVVARIVEGKGADGGETAAKEKPPREAPAETEGAEAPPAGEETKRPAAEAVRPAAGAEGRESAPASERAADVLQAGPAVRKLLAEHGIDPAEIRGTGRGGRITKADVLARVGGEEAAGESGAGVVTEEPAAKKETAEPAARKPEPAGAKPAPPPRPSAEGEDVERVRMSRLRQRIAERLVEAQRTAAILTTFNEIDMSAVMALRKEHKERFQSVHGVGLGFMSLFGRAVILALRDVPVVNAQIEGEEIAYHRRVHLGIAVGTERGLVVPVVRNADRMTIAELEAGIGELAALARQGRLLPDHLSGGTFTISNGGVYGSLLSTPILNPPQSGILGMHKIEQRPVVVNGEIVARPMMYVALSYDHRLVDGEQAVTFLVRVKERLEEPARMLLEV